ncbi:hypothetical protein [Salinicola rhizosphaerae]|uniref:Uncharacterized protein n=1 Tax=Salinicola rhizosphaerae TaxID=1443141 RepID=A0ABQ3DVV6_9GAMM|nr:hypothetical protein [Salinicola rhizosphaerae]GHB14762.1 hypothetical protein GCM10009038_11520 [Salinicola rhizosphaerae]
MKPSITQQADARMEAGIGSRPQRPNDIHGRTPVKLDMNCSICSHDQFYIPLNASHGRGVTCANCTALRCQIDDLESVLIQLSAETKRPAA